MYSRMTALLSVRHILINDGFVCMHTYAPVTQFCSLLLLLFIEVTVASLTFGTEDLFKKKKKSIHVKTSEVTEMDLGLLAMFCGCFCN